MSEQRAPSRRAVLRTAAVVSAVGAAGAVSAGCGFIAEGKQAAPAPTSPVTLGPASGVPVDGGTIYPAEQVVVTQPAAGEFEAFSAVCTHQGCLVSSVSDGAIHCPCHGSVFSASDGAVLVGPAAVPLPRASVKVVGADLILEP